jgi:Tol biopolymer transport system component/DNA-binding winged helix-turn-helix (wHTH) protein
MKPNSSSRAQVRIGSFELDIQAGELRQDGIKARLQEQPREILAMLLEHPGDVVTREELRRRLWPDHTFVDFDHGLNKAINKLRETLGDDADKPRYIETLPRRGYRLIAPVETVAPVSPPANRESPLQSTAEGTAQRQQEMPHRKRWIWLLAVSIGLIVAAALPTYLLTRPLPPPKVLGYVQITHSDLQKEGIVTDGSRLYFNASSAGQPAIYQVSASGGEMVPLAPTLPRVTLADISPKGDELLVVTDLYQAGGGAGPLWALPLVGGAPRRLGEAHAGGYYLAAAATWSPDGKSIAYSDDRALYVAASDGSRPRKLSPPTWAFRLRWSPDGRVLRFSTYDPKKGRAIWEVSADGGNAHPLLPEGSEPRGACCGNWTPDGRYFLFTDEQNLWALREKRGLFRRSRSKLIQLTNGPLLFSNPVPSKDGKRIFAVGEVDRGQLVRYDAITRQVVPYLSGLSAEGVSFSRDGGWVAYVMYPDGTLWRSKVDGSERLQLTFPPLVAGSSNWSPDGKRIAFMGTSRRGWKINLISADGGSAEELPLDDVVSGGASWSPDGQSLVFGLSTLVPVSSTSPNPIGVYTLDLKTRQVSILPGSEGLIGPRISPDGRFVVAQQVDDRASLALYDVNARRRTALVRGKLGMGWPYWSRDSRYVYFRSDIEAGPLVYRVRISDRKVEQVASLKDLRLANGSTLTNWMGLAPDGSPLFVRDVGSQEIYALDWEAP